MRRILALDTLHLSAGAHRANGNEMCVMEAVAYVAGEPWSDHPQCASPVIAAFCRTWNDTEEPYGQAIRDRLRFYVPRLVGSRGTPQQEERRAWLAMDWLIRVCAPAWLRLAGLTTHADALAQLPPQVSYKAVSSSAATRAAARAAARAAGDAAEDAAWAAGDAGTAARDVFKPTVGLLQTSAWQLLDAMLACQ